MNPPRTTKSASGVEDFDGTSNDGIKAALELCLCEPLTHAQQSPRAVFSEHLLCVICDGTDLKDQECCRERSPVHWRTLRVGLGLDKLSERFSRGRQSLRDQQTHLMLRSERNLHIDM